MDIPWCEVETSNKLIRVRVDSYYAGLPRGF
jgi:hypothetical protein